MTQPKSHEIAAGLAEEAAERFAGRGEFQPAIMHWRRAASLWMRGKNYQQVRHCLACVHVAKLDIDPTSYH